MADFGVHESEEHDRERIQAVLARLSKRGPRYTNRGYAYFLDERMNKVADGESPNIRYVRLGTLTASAGATLEFAQEAFRVIPCKVDGWSALIPSIPRTTADIEFTADPELTRDYSHYELTYIRSIDPDPVASRGGDLHRTESVYDKEPQRRSSMATKLRRGLKPSRTSSSTSASGSASASRRNSTNFVSSPLTESFASLDITSSSGGGKGKGRQSYSSTGEVSRASSYRGDEDDYEQL